MEVNNGSLVMENDKVQRVVFNLLNLAISWLFYIEKAKKWLLAIVAIALFIISLL